MKKIPLMMLALTALACNKDNASQAGTTASTVSSASTTSAPVAATQNVVDKALALVTGNAPFEGEITQTITDVGKPPMTFVYLVKGQKMRFSDPTGHMQGAYMLYDGATKTTTTVTDAKKMAMVMSFDPAAVAATGAAAHKSKIEKTSKTDTVAGYSCEIWNVVEESGDKAEICVAHGISYPLMKTAPSWAGDLGDAFPLRMTSVDATGKPKMRMEVTKIDKKSVDDAQLSVPAGYKTMNMGDMMRSFGGGASGMPGMPH